MHISVILRMKEKYFMDDEYAYILVKTGEKIPLDGIVIKGEKCGIYSTKSGKIYFSKTVSK